MDGSGLAEKKKTLAKPHPNHHHLNQHGVRFPVRPFGK